MLHNYCCVPGLHVVIVMGHIVLGIIADYYIKWHYLARYDHHM